MKAKKVYWMISYNNKAQDIKSWALSYYLITFKLDFLEALSLLKRIVPEPCADFLSGTLIVLTASTNINAWNIKIGIRSKTNRMIFILSSPLQIFTIKCKRYKISSYFYIISRINLFFYRELALIMNKDAEKLLLY